MKLLKILFWQTFVFYKLKRKSKVCPWEIPHNSKYPYKTNLIRGIKSLKTLIWQTFVLCKIKGTSKIRLCAVFALYSAKHPISINTFIISETLKFENNILIVLIVLFLYYTEAITHSAKGKNNIRLIRKPQRLRKRSFYEIVIFYNPMVRESCIFVQYLFNSVIWHKGCYLRSVNAKIISSPMKCRSLYTQCIEYQYRAGYGNMLPVRTMFWRYDPDIAILPSGFRADLMLCSV